jgi:hypothetical protein
MPKASRYPITVCTDTRIRERQTGGRCVSITGRAAGDMLARLIGFYTETEPGKSSEDSVPRQSGLMVFASFKN